MNYRRYYFPPLSKDISQNKTTNIAHTKLTKQTFETPVEINKMNNKVILVPRNRQKSLPFFDKSESKFRKTIVNQNKTNR